jgi:hypothetical protein
MGQVIWAEEWITTFLPHFPQRKGGEKQPQRLPLSHFGYPHSKVAHPDKGSTLYLVERVVFEGEHRRNYKMGHYHLKAYQSCWSAVLLSLQAHPSKQVLIY